MRIAIPLANDTGTLAERFSPAQHFALYDVHDQTRAVTYLGRQTFDQPGCGRTPAFLREHGVEVLLAHEVSENAVNHLLEVGIVAIEDAPILTSDALIAHLVSGTLQAKPPIASEGGCGSGGCGHCGSHGQDHAEPASDAQPCAEGGSGCCGGHAHDHHEAADAAISGH